MGFLSSIGKAVGGAVKGASDFFGGGSSLLSAGSSLLGGWFGREGQDDANAANAQMAKKQMEFQERMSSTAYQRAVKDMQQAGLNPMLAYTQGPASSPGGSSAVMQNKNLAGAQAASMVTQNMASAAQVDQIKANTRNIDADTANKQLQPELIAEQVRNLFHSSGQMAAATKRTEQDIQQFERTWEEQLRKLRGEAKEAHYKGEGGSMDYNRRIATQNEEIERIRAEVDRLKLMAKITGLQVPAAINEADFELSTLGHASRSTKFLLDSGQDIGSIIGNIGRGRPRSGSSLTKTFRNKDGSTTTSREYRDE